MLNATLTSTSWKCRTFHTLIGVVNACAFAISVDMGEQHIFDLAQLPFTYNHVFVHDPPNSITAWGLGDATIVAIEIYRWHEGNRVGIKPVRFLL